MLKTEIHPVIARCNYYLFVLCFVHINSLQDNHPIDIDLENVIRWLNRCYEQPAQESSCKIITDLECGVRNERAAAVKHGGSETDGAIYCIVS